MKKKYTLPFIFGAIVISGQGIAQSEKTSPPQILIIEKMKSDGRSDQEIWNYIELSNYAQKRSSLPVVNVSCVDGFETGDFTGWNGELGCHPNSGSCSGYLPGFQLGPPTPPGRHTIVPYTNYILDPCYDTTAGSPTIPLPAPNFGNYSAQLGNNNTGCESEKLLFTFPVNSTDTNFLFTYSVVMEDAGHDSAHQPFFNIYMLDTNNDTIPNSYYYYVGGPNPPGFYPATLCGLSFSTWYKPWTLRGVSLAPYIGQQVTLVAISSDCGYCGHYGYGYIDIDCDGNLISPRYCPGGPVTLNAASEPNSQYLWEDGSITASLAISNPVSGDTISCVVTPWGGYTFRANYILTPAQSAFTSSVSTNTVTLTNNSSGSVSCFWDFGDGNTSTNCNPTHVYGLVGTYTVCLTVTTDGCSSGVTSCATVTILSTGVSDYFFQENISVTPNPASDIIFIEFKNGKVNEKTEVSIFNLIGAEIMKTTILPEKGKSSINVSSLPSGTYFIKLKSDDGEITNKLIVSEE